MHVSKVARMATEQCKKKNLTNTLVLVVLRNALVDVWPVGPGEVGLDAGAGNNVDAVLGQVEHLKQCDDTGAGVIAHTGAVVVELDHVILVGLGYLVHDVVEPLGGVWLLLLKFSPGHIKRLTFK